MAEYIWAILPSRIRVPDGRCADHDLVRGHAAAAGLLQQGLGNDGAQ